MPGLAGYTFADGTDHQSRGYFAHGSRLAFDFHMPDLPHCGLPVITRDPLGNDSTIAYDRPYHLLPVQATDAIGLTTSAEHDYRVLQPQMVTDVNGNRRAVSFSPLGFVTSTAVLGKEGESAGDTLEVPGSRMEYDFFAFVNRQQPVFVHSLVREHHVTEADVPLPERDRTIESIQYSDGFGRLLQTRTQAEDVLFGDPNFGGGVLSADQSVVMGDAIGRQRAPGASLNVVVSGSQVYDNKGRVVEKYEPFFAVGLDYAAPGDAQFGQKATMFYDPRGQVIRTLNPDGSEQRVIHGIPADLRNPEQFAPTPWEAYTYDANDLAPLSHGPDGASLASVAPATHHFTPSSIVLDALGRTIEAIARNGSDPADWFRTRSAYDIRGNVLTVTDALNRVAFRYTYDLANRPWRNESIDAGLRRIVLNVLGNEIERRDSKGALLLQAYDRLHRPIRLWARDDAGSPVTLRQRMEYGDAGTPAQPLPERAAMRANNLLGQLIRHHDEAGLTTVAAVDFKGNVLDKSRRAIADAPILAVFNQASANGWQITPFQMDWEPRPQKTIADREAELLETAVYQTTASYDALNRIKRMQLPQDVEGKRRELRPTYNNAGGLEKVFLDDTLYVERIAYDAKGQRALIAYGNGVMARYAYDPRTFRLKRLRSERYSKPDDVTYHPGGEALQDFGYDYDLVGNIAGIRDRAPGSGILNNPEAALVSDSVLAQLLIKGDALNRRFDYDPIYRLLAATGRECDLPPDGEPWQDQPRCTDLTKTRAYTERYAYDAMGNMLRLEHRNEPGGFTREFTVETANNRLRRVQIGQSVYDYAFDANSNTRSETTSRHFEWNHSDQMKAFRTQTEGAEPSVHAHYLYDAAGQRVKKLVRKQGGQVEVTHYIEGVFELHRWGSGAQAGENNHVHVTDDKQRIALVRIGNAHPEDKGPAVQFHLGDHLGSSNVVVNADEALVNREEFTPYGETSFGSFARKRYRYTGKERDEETGFNYHGARYYAAWLGRWVSCDPIGIEGGINVYRFCQDNPIVFVDLAGQDSSLTVYQEGEEKEGYWFSSSVHQEGEEKGNYWYNDNPSRAIAATYLEGEVTRNPFPSRQRRHALERLETFNETGVDPGPHLNLEGAPGPENIGLGIQLPSMIGAATLFPTLTAIAGGWELGLNTGEALTGKSSGLHISNLANRNIDVGRPLETTERVAAGLEASMGWLMSGMMSGKIFQTQPWKGAGPAPGTFGVAPETQSVKGLQNYYPKRKAIEFIFDPEKSTFVVGDAPGNWSPHCRLADTINANPRTVVGGMFRRGQSGEMLTNEFSGHFWQNWTPAVRQKFVDFMSSKGLRVIHSEGM